MIKLKWGEHRLAIQQGWHEVEYDQWIALQQSKDFVDVLCILLGKDRETIIGFGSDFVLQIVPFLNWASTPVDKNQWAIPETLEIAGQKVKTNIKLDEQTWGQKLCIHEMMKAQAVAGKNNDEIIAKTIAYYLQPFVHRCKFDYNKADELVPEIGKMKMCDVLPVAGFFLTRCSRSSSANTRNST